MATVPDADQSEGPEEFSFDVETRFGMTFDVDRAEEHGTDVAAYDAMDELFRVVKHTVVRFVFVAETLGYDREDLWDALDQRSFDTLGEAMEMYDELLDEMENDDEHDDADAEDVPVEAE